MPSFSSLLRIVTTVALLLLATTGDNNVRHQYYAKAIDSDEYQRAQLVGGAVSRHSTRHLRSGQKGSIVPEGNHQQHSNGAEYIPGWRVGKTLHTVLHDEQHETPEATTS